MFVFDRKLAHGSSVDDQGRDSDVSVRHEEVTHTTLPHYTHTHEVKHWLTLGAHGQRRLRYLVCKCVCLSVCYHVFCHCATRQQNSDTNGFIATLASFKKGDFHKTTAFKSYDVKSK